MAVYKTYTCETCNKVVRKANTKGRFCSLKCQHDKTYLDFIAAWLADEIDATTGVRVPKPSKHVYRYFKETITECEICGIHDWQGKSITLEIDHIDGIRTNNKRSNLRYICPNCHSQTDTFRNKKR